jgi:recombinational DNA repair protein (RecF pathway)
MNGQLRTGEAIVLHSTKGKEGGKALTLFTASRGLLKAFIPRAALAGSGTGLTAPFAHIRYTAALFPEYAVIRQYEGELLFDMMKLSYEDMAYWFYLIELTEKLFPPGVKDDGVYDTLLEVGKAGRTRNSIAVTFIASVQVLALSGFDAAAPEAVEQYHITGDTAKLLTAFRDYCWHGPFQETIGKRNFLEAAGYLDRFLQDICDIRMNTKGTFTKALETGET